jgi:hypothetical protein
MTALIRLKFSLEALSAGVDGEASFGMKPISESVATKSCRKVITSRNVLAEIKFWSIMSLEQTQRDLDQISYVFAEPPDIALCLALGRHPHTFIEGLDVGKKVTVRCKELFSGTNDTR